MRKSWLFDLLRYLIGGGTPLLRDPESTLASSVVEDLQSYLTLPRKRARRTPRLHTYLGQWVPSGPHESYLLLVAWGFWMAEEYACLVVKDLDRRTSLDEALADPWGYIQKQYAQLHQLKNSPGAPPDEAPSSEGASPGAAGPGPANPSPAGGESSVRAASSDKKQPAGADPTPAG